MCHWLLRIWKCGDSYFTKHSSCSFDRAAHDPRNLLNPLHPSITPCGVEARPLRTGVNIDRLVPQNENTRCNQVASRNKHRKSESERANTNTTSSSSNGGCFDPISPPRTHGQMPELPTQAESHAAAPNESKPIYPRDANTGEKVPIPLSEVGKASRFGDNTLNNCNRCNVFEVVLQSKELTVCPACARSPRRARLPAHARGCFGLS